MYRLSISLILAVLASVFFTGWLADRFFNERAENYQAPDHALQTRGYVIVELIESGVIKHEHIEELASASPELSPHRASGDNHPLSYAEGVQETMAIVDRGDLSLPVSLQDQLYSGQPLILESNERLHWYHYLSSTNKVFSLSHLVLPDKGHNMRLVFTVLFYLCVAGLILVWVYPLTRQLKRLGVAAESLGKGDLSLRISTHPANRLHDIELQFNRMAHRLQLLVEDNKLLCNAVSHDLRTPLARLRFGVDTLTESLAEAQGSRHNDPVPEYLDRIASDLTRMEELVHALLDFAKLDQSLQNSPKVKVDLQDIVYRCKESQTCRAEIVLRTETSTQRYFVEGDDNYALMLLNNLVDNALRFATSRVLVSISQDGDNVYLRVEDDGPGMDLAMLDRLKKPFERGEKPAADTRDDQGYGLGLALVDRLSQWMGGKLLIEKSERLNGASVCIVFDACST